MNKSTLAAAAFSLCLFTGIQAQSIYLIPQPRQVDLQEGHFNLNEETTISFNDAELGFLAGYTADRIEKLANVKPLAGPGTAIQSGSNTINLVMAPGSGANPEGYILEITSNRITIRAPGSQGVFYGVQTFLQLIPENQSPKIPCLVISDEPRFRWRGILLDVSRHFFTLDEVEKLIDQMVAYKFNLLHLHLSDDQGWRLEIKQLPELTRVGAWRVPRTGLWWERDKPQPGEKAVYGGFYTQEDIRHLVSYAARRHVDILPEIDVPGHSLAAIASHPFLSCTKKSYQVNPGSKFYGIDDNSLCAGNDSTFEFLDKVFTEVADLFPFEYIHIGGDECFKGFWKTCPDCQKRMKDHDLKDLDELQSYFIKRLEKILEAKGKKLMGWDEILEGGLAPNAAVMSWRGMQGGIAAANAGHHVVMSPNSYAYLDLYQGDPAIEPPTYSMLRLEKVYQFEPVPEGVDPSLILGGQGNLWTESVPTFRQAEYMLWPRSCALAEVLWSPADTRNWEDFIRRTEIHLKRLSDSDVNHAVSLYDAIISTKKDDKGNLLIALDAEIEDLDIYYTFDNTYPDHHGPKYEEGEFLSIPKDADTFRVVTYRNGKPLGRIITVPTTDLEKRKNLR